MTQCPFCSAPIKKEAKFCPQCGQPAHAQRTRSPHASSVPAWAYVTTVVALGIGIWGAYQAGVASATSDRAPSSPMAVSPTPPAGMIPPAEANPYAGDPRVEAVASRFLCSCGNCGGDTVWVCDCTHPKGAMEVKAFIARHLSSGKSVDDVISLVKAQYGGFIK